MTNINTIVLQADDSTSQNSAAIPADQLEYASFQAVFGDATAAGSVKLQASNDFDKSGGTMSFTPTHWNDIPSSSQSVASGATTLIPATILAYQFIRVVFTNSSGGSSTITVTMSARSKK